MARDSEDLRNDVTTKEDFQAGLQILVMKAYSNGVGIRGSWPVMRQDDPTRGWKIAITAVSSKTNRE